MNASEHQTERAGEAVQRPVDEERARFERWASNEGDWPAAIQREGSGYRLMATHLYWQAWQARAGLDCQQ